MATNLFDANLYRSLYSDLGKAGLTTDEQLRQHFLSIGIVEGRQFSKYVDLNYYTNSYPDLKSAGLNSKLQLFNHAEQFGAAEGRRLGAAFNASYYKAVNTDLTQAGFNNEQLTQHYQSFGNTEGRRGSEFFDPVFYLNTYADLKQAFGNNYQLATQHFLNNGINEGRLGSGPVAPSFDPGSTAKTAYELGSLVTRPTFNEFVGTGDQQDFYRIILDKPSNLSLNLSGLSANTNLRVYADVNGNQDIEAGEEIASAVGSSANPGLITRSLSQGSYYVDVVTGSPTSNTSYSLNFAASGIVTNTPSDPGNSPGTALNVGTLSGSRHYQDFVGVTDRDDWYKFVLDGASNFNLSLNGVFGSAVVNLYADTNNNGSIEPGEFIATGVTNNAPIPHSIPYDTIARTLGAGTYFVDVVTNSSTANTSYSLTMSA